MMFAIRHFECCGLR